MAKDSTNAKPLRPRPWANTRVPVHSLIKIINASGSVQYIELAKSLVKKVKSGALTTGELQARLTAIKKLLETP